MAKISIHALVWTALALPNCESCFQPESRPYEGAKPAVSISDHVRAAQRYDGTSCTVPDLHANKQVVVRQLGSRPVVLSFSAPQFSGRDAILLDQRLDVIAKQTLADREREWKNCPIASPLGLECFEWKIEAKCEIVEIGSVFSVVCMNRLSDEYRTGPTIDYTAAHFTDCGGTLKILDFEKDLCPAWGCLDELYKAFREKGFEGDTLNDESARTIFESSARNFYFAKEHIVFLLGDIGIGNLPYDERFEFGYKVMPLQYAEMVQVSPTALDVLRNLGLVPKN